MRPLGLKILFSLLASACSLAIAGPASSQGSTLGSEDAAMLDALAALLFNLEEGRPTLPLNDPTRREIVNGAITYQYVEPSYLYGSTEEAYQDRADSKYRWRHTEVRLTSPCSIRVEDTIEYSQGDSKESFGQNVIRHILAINLSNYRRFEFAMDTSIAGYVAMNGENIFCNQKGETQSCIDEYDHPIGMPGGLTASDSEREAFKTRRLQAAETVRKQCPPRSD